MKLNALRPGEAAPVTGHYDIVTIYGDRLGCRYHAWEGTKLPLVATTTGMPVPVRYVPHDTD